MILDAIGKLQDIYSNSEEFLESATVLTSQDCDRGTGTYKVHCQLLPVLHFDLYIHN